MKLRPERFNAPWNKAECDPDGQVEYQLAPPPESVRAALVARHIGFNVQEGEVIPDENQVEFAYDLAMHSLIDLRGMTDEDGNPVEMAKDVVSIGSGKRERVKREWFERLPGELQAEIVRHSGELVALAEEEREGANFTRTSQSQSSSATDASKPALTIVGTEGSGLDKTE